MHIFPDTLKYSANIQRKQGKNLNPYGYAMACSRKKKEAYAERLSFNPL